MGSYTMLAISVPDIVEALPQGLSLPIKTSGLFAMLDEKFTTLCKTNMPDIFRESKYTSANNIAEDWFLDARDWIKLGPSSAFTSVITSAAGIEDPVFYNDGQLLFNLSQSTDSKIVIFPCQTLKFLMKGEAIKHAFMKIPERTALYSLAKGLGAQNKLTIVEAKPLKVECLKTALETLCDEYNKRVKYSCGLASGLDYWILLLISSYLEKQKFSDTNLLNVYSTYYGDIINCGGMVKGIPYLSIGDLAARDDESWDDPRESGPDLVKEIQAILLGQESNKYKFERFNPDFED